MATTTPNFNWPVPTSTDLVKDGATAIEALGDSIDASLVDLKGGTTGQVLAKASNTDMDFTWVTDAAGDITGVTAGTGISGGGTSGTVTVTNSMATAITTKGDLVAGTGSGTFARLAASENGSTIVADSSATTGLRYQGNNAAGKNAVINGDCLVAQRGTSAITLSSATSTHYPVDRFFAVGHSGSTAQQITSISNTSFKNAVRVQRTAGNTTTSDLSLTQTFETDTSIPFQGKTVTLSFWARAGANFSPTSGTLTSRVYTGTGTNQGGFGFTWTGTANPLNQANTLTTSWQRFTVSGTISSTATQIQIFFFCTPTGTAGAADNFDITGVQLEAGSVATAFQTATGTIQGELAACQRYFYRYNAAATTGPLGVGSYYGSTTLVVPIQMKQTMRTAPSATFNNPTNFTAYSNGAARAATAMSLDIANTDVYSVTITTSAATAGNAASVNAVQTNASIDFSSEL